MSLETLRAMRRAGAKPGEWLKVVVGGHSLVADRPDVIVVADRPEFMDWRPVVGLPVVVFCTDAAVDLGERAFDCAAAAGCIPVGVVFRDGGHAPEGAMPILRQMWELLCLS